MLSAEARRLFARLAVFQGGWDAEGAAQVCLSREPSDSPQSPSREADGWSAFDLLERLLSESLLIADERNGVMRFRMLETLREFAWEQLPPQEQERLLCRHATYLMRFAEEIETKLDGPELRDWLNRLEEERANLTAALTWCVESQATEQSPSPAEIGLRIMGALWRFWDMRGSVREAREFTERLLERAPPECAPKVFARAFNTAGTFAQAESDYAAALAHFREALAQWRRAGSTVGVATILGNMGTLYGDQANLEAALDCYTEGLAIVRELAIPRRIATFLNNLGTLRNMMGDFDAAQDHLLEALALRKQIGDRRAVFSTLNNLAALAHYREDYAAAISGQEEALAIARELEDRFAAAVSLVNLGNNYLSVKDYPACYRCFIESLQLHAAVGSRFGQAYALEGLAVHAVSVALPERAGILRGASQSLRESIQAVHAPREQEILDAAFTSLAADPSFLVGLKRGKDLPLEAALSVALRPL